MTRYLLESRLTCPVCAHAETLAMPTDACQWFYECPACKTLLKPKPGVCCVFCSYALGLASVVWFQLLKKKTHPDAAT